MTRLRRRAGGACQVLYRVRPYDGLAELMRTTWMNDIVIYPSKGKMVLLAFVLLAAAVMSGSMVVFRQEMEVPVWVAGVGVIGVLIFLGAFFWSLYRLFSHAPSVIVNRDGITDNAAATSVGLIRWEEISQITVFRMNYTNNVGIILVDHESFFNRLPSAKASLLKAAWRLTQVPISIPQSTLSVSAEDLARQIIAYRQALPITARPAPHQYPPMPPAPTRPPPPPPPPPVIAPAPEPSLSMRCLACGSSSQGTKFCPNCGQAMPRRTECSKCGTKVQTETKFCPECGARIV